MAILIWDGFSAYGADATTFPSAGDVRYSGASNPDRLTFASGAQRYPTTGGGIDKGMRSTQSSSVEGAGAAGTRCLLYQCGASWASGNGLWANVSYNPIAFTGAQGIMSFLTATGAPVFGLVVTSTGYLQLRDLVGLAEDPVLASAFAAPLSEGAWVWIGVEVDNTAGDVSEVRVYVNKSASSPSPVLTYSTTISTSGIVDLALGYSPTNGPNGLGLATADMDDFVLGDTSGAAPYNASLTEHREEGTFGDAEVGGQVVGYTRTGGASVQDAVSTLDGDTSYYGSDIVDDRFLLSTSFTLSNTPASIAGVGVVHVSRKTLAAAREVRPLIRTGGTNYENDPDALGSIYGLDFGFWSVNPNTAAAWQRADVEGADYGLTVES